MTSATLMFREENRVRAMVFVNGDATPSNIKRWVNNAISQLSLESIGRGDYWFKDAQRVAAYFVKYNPSVNTYILNDEHMNSTYYFNVDCDNYRIVSIAKKCKKMKKLSAGRTIKETDFIIKCSIAWKKFGSQFGWKLHSFTYDQTAYFYASDDIYANLIYISASVRDSIQKVIDAANGGCGACKAIQSEYACKKHCVK
jgi:hypothetical protein